MHKIIIILVVFFVSFSHCAKAIDSSGDLETQLVYRVAIGSAADVNILLGQGANPNAKNIINRPAIVIAAARNHTDSAKIVQYLAEKGANPAVFDQQGDNAFTAAIATGTSETISYLLQWKPTYKMKNGYGEDLLEIAKKRHDATIYAMVEKFKNDEIEEWTRLTSGQNRQKLFKEFAFRTCAEEYMIFYYSNEHEENPDQDLYDKRMTKIAKEILSTLKKLEKYFSLSRGELGGVESLSRETISTQLADMGSSDFRVRSGVGTNADLQKRCGKVALDISLRTAIRRK